MSNPNTFLKSDIVKVVSWALEEDVRDGDIIAALIPEDEVSKATIITREHAIISGIEWVNEVFRQVDP